MVHGVLKKLISSKPAYENTHNQGAYLLNHHNQNTYNFPYEEYD